MPPEETKHPKHDDCTRQDTESNWQSSNAYSNRVLAVDIERLCGPEKQDGKEVCAGYEGDDQSKTQDPRTLLQAGWEHGVLGEFGFPDEESHNKEEANEEGGESVGGFPGVLGVFSAVCHLALSIGRKLT